ncbi:MAG: HPr kinase/phosphatase C-terminal domain-containing protein [Hyphomicrobiaceae bacterium]|nr:HPr kinase/phosphatase C-terminal domain-containing protein [Hyphomicrobiaceae bacterium]
MVDATEPRSVTVHATCVTFSRTAALIRGPSGSGKSDLALRFLFLSRRGPAAVEAPLLVADDRVILERGETGLLARAPEAIRGKLEVRGVGIVQVKHALEAGLVALVDLVAPQEIERMPEPARETLLGVSLPVFRLAPFEASAPIKLAALIALARTL